MDAIINRSSFRISIFAPLLFIPLLLGGCLTETQTQKADPVAVDFPVAYVKRPIPLNNQGQPRNSDLRQLDDFNAGGDLYIKDRSSAGAREHNITGAFTQGMGDVKDLDVSYDGNRVIFAMRAPEIENADDDEQPTWNIWEYNIAERSLRRIITSDITAEAGQDVAPHYLPDGRIVFSSTRQRQSGATLLDEGKPRFTAENEDRSGPAFVLHVMNSDGSDIRQISFNQSSDFDPAVLSSGEILFSRWDNMGSSNAINLYKMRPDGTRLQLLYGAHSHQTGTNGATIQFLDPRELPDGRLAAITLPFRGSNGGGDIIAIDVNHFADNRRNIADITTLSQNTAQQPLMAANIHTDGTLSPGGLYRSAYPLHDGSNRLLVSWSPCRLMVDEKVVTCTERLLTDPEAKAAPPLYSIYMYDPNKGTHAPLVIPQENTIIEEAVIAQARRLPQILMDNAPGPNFRESLVAENSGILHIRSVYDIDGRDGSIDGIATLADPVATTADQRPARFLRIVKGVPLPDRDVLRIPGTAFGPSNQLMREIIGYTTVEPDGSVMVKVPANVPLTISVLDKNGRSITPRHQNWLQVRPGEIRECGGCHDHDSNQPNDNLPHGRDGVPPPVNRGATTSGIPFLNTDPRLIAEMGETMAQTRARISCESDCATLTPSVDVVFEDHWTDTGERPKDESFAYRYADLTTAIPVNSGCITQWTPLCRTVIHYESHIHPLWGKDRGADTCTNCHISSDADGMPRVPDAQLDLGDGPSVDVGDHFNAYRELLFPDNEVELDMASGILVERMVQATANGVPLFVTDANGEQILDNSGQPIPVMVPVRANGPSMSGSGARGSPFFSKFDTGGSHTGRLSPAELRLIAEWLDIGAQYYNNPFAVPE